MHIPLPEYLLQDPSATAHPSSSSWYERWPTQAPLPVPFCSPPVPPTAFADSFPSEQDSEIASLAPGPSFLLKLSNDDDLLFTFTFVIRQAQQVLPGATGSPETVAQVDTHINGLTYVYASTPREVENLVTREFHADPNLHKNSNVDLVGDYGTDGSPSVSFEWTWKWKPPRSFEDKGGGWRNSCSVRPLFSPAKARTRAHTRSC